jgi:hypothetical protein
VFRLRLSRLVAVSRCQDKHRTNGKQDFYFLCVTTASIPALRPIQLPTQWVKGTISPGIKRPEGQAGQSPGSSTKITKWHSKRTQSHSLKVRERTLSYFFVACSYLRITESHSREDTTLFPISEFPNRNLGPNKTASIRLTQYLGAFL